MNDKQQLMPLGEEMAKCHHIERQRNDLLDALENLVYYVTLRGADPDDVYATIAHARATIERCKQ